MSHTYVTNSSGQLAYIQKGSAAPSGAPVAAPIPFSATTVQNPQPTGPTWTQVRSTYSPYK